MYFVLEFFGHLSKDLWQPLLKILDLISLILFKERYFCTIINEEEEIRRQCGPVVRALALRSGDPGFKTHSDHSLNLFLVVPGSTFQLHL